MRSSALLPLAFPLVFAVVACSGNPTSPIDGGSDGGCIAPVEGASCSQSDVACQPPGDICCVGYAWMCQNGQWTKAGVGCACQVEAGVPDGGPFACGPSATCNSSTQYCVDQAPGIAFPDGGTPPDSYTCNSLPTACALDPTCACVTAHNACPTSVASCDDTGGQVTVHCMGQ
jgi:hypothetical protein